MASPITGGRSVSTTRKEVRDELSSIGSDCTSSDSELSASPRVGRAVPFYVSQYHPGHHKLVEPYYYSPRPAKDKNDLINRSESDLYTSYSTGMWVLGGLFSLVSVVAPGVVSAFSSVQPGKMSEK